MSSPQEHVDHDLGARLQTAIDELSEGDTTPLGAALTNIKLAQARIDADTAHRDWLIADAVERGLSLRKVSAATGMSRKTVTTIVDRVKASAA